jgi:hypothetical protein
MIRRQALGYELSALATARWASACWKEEKSCHFSGQVLGLAVVVQL